MPSRVTKIPLRALLENLLIERAHILDDQDFQVILSVPDESCAPGNEQLSRLLLANLLDNALHYASPHRLEILLRGSSLILENPRSAHVQPRHGASLGHGLSLVKRLAGAQGWKFCRESSGDVFRVSLSW